MQLESCITEIDRMKYNEIIEKDIQKLKLQMSNSYNHSYKFGNYAVQLHNTFDTILQLLIKINDRLSELDYQISEIDIKLRHHDLAN